MYTHKASIGRSFYEIPYQSQDDLKILSKICEEANQIVNTILSSDSTVTNEFALLLALINTIYDSKTISNTSQSARYTQNDILDIISSMQNILLDHTVK